MQDVSVVVTSYNRPDLLKRTLESFNNAIQYDFGPKIVIDDFSSLEFTDEIREVCKSCGFTYIGMPYKCGQLKCIDSAYRAIRTPYIFHCEDDWLFENNSETKHNLIDNMKQLLEYDNDAVVILARKDCPLGSINQVKQTHNGIGYYQHNLWWNGQWGGYTLNPGLIRKSDYETHINSFYNHFTDESKVSVYYLKLGKYILNLDETQQCYYHIGEGRSNDPHLSNKREI